MQAHIRYLALLSDQPDVVADFYGTYFGLRELGRSAAGDVSLTDGCFNLTLLKRRADLAEPNAATGLHHFGVAVDDLDDLRRRLANVAPGADLEVESGDVHHGEYRVVDPNGLPVSLSTRSFGVPPSHRGFPEIHHVAMKVHNREAVLDFYTQLFGFHEVSSSLANRKKNLASRFIGDGATNLAILAAGDLQRDPDAPGNIPKVGVNHFGLVVHSMEEMLDRLPHDANTSQRPANRTMAEFRTFDPDGNGMDISSRAGWEVELDHWVRAT